MRIIDETGPVVRDTVIPDSGDDIARALSEYTTVEPEKKEILAATSADLSDPTKYYQSGKKKGQPKKSRTETKDRPPVQSAEVQAISSELITGVMLITFIDLLIPMIIAAINNKVSKVKVDFEKLQLTDKQKKAVEPLADQAAKHIRLNIHPVALCAVGIMGMYSLQLIQLRAIEKQKLGIK